MKKLIRVLGLTVGLALLIGLMAACDEPVLEDVNLGVPANVVITVVQRTMTITWTAVPNAQGYEIITTSVDCASGNRIINTKDNTAYAFAADASYLKTDKTNGAVEILGPNRIQITLMPQMMGDQNVPMASKVTAKVRALGGVADWNNYLDSGYSAVVERTLGGGM